jgi:predicted SAM-dependent methyltransferase
MKQQAPEPEREADASMHDMAHRIRSELLSYNPSVSVHAAAGRLQRRVGAFLRRGDTGISQPSAAPFFAPGGSPDSVHRTRESIATAYLSGNGIEIGALHQPLRVPTAARVRYVDRMTAPDLRRQYPELAGSPLVDIDIIDDGERLATIETGSQDFVIANHFIEHCQNPVLTLQNLFRVLKAGGVLYMAVPDKRFTFDVDRPCTTAEHVMRDFTDGPEGSRLQHFEEWARLVNKRVGETEVAEEVRRLVEMDYSIHFHVWGAAELLEFIVTVQHVVGFEVELFLRNGFETILILRKSPV